MICLQDIQAYVGAPPAPRCETYRKAHGELVAWAWRDASFGAKDGWWCALTCDAILLEASWTVGGRLQRDEELAKMLAKHKDVGQAVAAAAS